MIVQDKLTRADGAELVVHYSDEGYYIRQIETGAIYDAATDIVPCPYTYEETDEIIPLPDQGDEDEEALPKKITA